MPGGSGPDRCQIMVIQAIVKTLAFTLTQIGSPWQVLGVKDCCDLIDF